MVRVEAYLVCAVIEMINVYEVIVIRAFQNDIYSNRVQISSRKLISAIERPFRILAEKTRGNCTNVYFIGKNGVPARKEY